MQSGKQDYNLDLSGSAVSDEIARIKANSGLSGLVVIKSASNNDFTVRFDKSAPNGGRIQIEDLRVSGGYIELDAHITNTGKGEIRLLGGYADITVNNPTGYDTLLKGLDASQKGAGTLIINDRSQADAHHTATYVTMYEKTGD